jgi:hypothetical protein
VLAVTIELTTDEAGMLRSILENDLSDLRMEIANTDSQDFRDALKRREELLKRLVATLSGGRA